MRSICIALHGQHSQGSSLFMAKLLHADRHAFCFFAAACRDFLPSMREQSLWEFAKSLLGQAQSPREYPLPTDKLSCKRASPHGLGQDYRPVVLVSCGSFNPPTVMHLRMFELAAQHLSRVRRFALEN